MESPSADPRWDNPPEEAPEAPDVLEPRLQSRLRVNSLSFTVEVQVCPGWGGPHVSIVVQQA